MDKIVKFGVVLVLLYIGFTYGKPWLENLTASRGGDSGTFGDDDASRCVALAEGANEAVSSGVSRFASPPIDRDAWSSTYQMSQGRIQQARNACSCVEEACDTASRALDALESLLGDFDGAFSGGSPPLNAGYDQGRVVDLLEQARAQAR